MPNRLLQSPINRTVVEAYRLDRYDNSVLYCHVVTIVVVEAYRLDRYDNPMVDIPMSIQKVVEAYRLDRYDNFEKTKRPVLPIVTIRGVPLC